MKKIFYAIFIFIKIFCAEANGSPTPIIFATDGMGTSLVPPETAGTFNLLILNSAGHGLVKEDANGRIYSEISRKWKSDTSYNRFEFDISNSKLKFCDGTALNAASILKSFKVAIDLGKNGRLGSVLKNIKSINQIGRNILVFNLKEPQPSFVRDLADPGLVIFKLEKNRETAAPCVSGDLEIKRMENNDYNISFKKNQTRILFKNYTSDQFRQEILSGKVDVALSYTYDQLSLFKKKFRTLLKYREGKTYFLALNSQTSKFRSKVKRDLFFRCFEYQSVQNFFNSFGLNPVLNFNFHSKVDKVNMIDCQNFRDLKVIGQKGHSMQAVAEIGFKNISAAKLTELEKKDLIETLELGDYDIYLGSLSFLRSDYKGMLKLFSQNLYNFSRFNSPEMISAANEVRAAQSERQILKGWEGIATINNKENLYIFFGTQASYYGFSDRVKYVPIHGNDGSIQESGYIDLNQLVLNNEFN